MISFFTFFYFLVFYCFIITLCLPFVANKRVHLTTTLVVQVDQSVQCVCVSGQ